MSNSVQKTVWLVCYRMGLDHNLRRWMWKLLRKADLHERIAERMQMRILFGETDHFITKRILDDELHQTVEVCPSFYERKGDDTILHCSYFFELLFWRARLVWRRVPLPQTKRPRKRLCATKQL